VTDHAITIAKPDGSQQTFVIDEGTVGVDEEFAEGAWVQIDFVVDPDTSENRAIRVVGSHAQESGVAPADPAMESAPPTDVAPAETKVETGETMTETGTESVPRAETETASELAVEDTYASGATQSEDAEMGAEAETGEWATAPVTPGAEREESLPATASALPLAGLTGVLALMGAAALAVARRHRRR
jgi:hypothetical protein